MSETKAPAQKSLSTFQLASYGAPSMPLSMVSLPLAVYLTPVYADSAGFGLSLAFVGLMLALSRVFDGITDPVIGFLGSNPHTLGTPQTLRAHWHADFYARRLAAMDSAL